MQHQTFFHALECVKIYPPELNCVAAMCFAKTGSMECSSHLACSLKCNGNQPVRHQVSCKPFNLMAFSGFKSDYRLWNKVNQVNPVDSRKKKDQQKCTNHIGADSKGHVSFLTRFVICNRFQVTLSSYNNLDVWRIHVIV